MKTKNIKKYMVFLFIVAGVIISFLISAYCAIRDIGELDHAFCEALFVYTVCIFLAFLLPIVMTLLSIIFIFVDISDDDMLLQSRLIEFMTIGFGIILSLLALLFSDIKIFANWTETLVNLEKHTPIFTGSYLTIFIFMLVGICGYLFLSFIPIKKMSPFAIVLNISSIYIGIIVCTMWIIQVFYFENIYLCFLSFNFILINVKLIKNKIIEWNKEEREIVVYNSDILNKANEYLAHSKRWPVIAFLLMLPLLGFFICILSLFGQKPDAAIKAWTETSDWNLSQRIAPQNIIEDEHYLCTVAAGGHKKVVKPIRLGVRHGHEVIVNRQLCIANAFEEIIQEKTPSFHKAIRYFYDTFGFPIAKLIKSQYVADLVYFIMKPLEWIFLIVIYLCDVKPENRIALQYIDKNYENRGIDK